MRPREDLILISNCPFSTHTELFVQGFTEPFELQGSHPSVTLPSVWKPVSMEILPSGVVEPVIVMVFVGVSHLPFRRMGCFRWLLIYSAHLLMN